MIAESPELCLSTPPKDRLDAILSKAAAQHSRLCPRQVLGARMALAAAELLGVEVPRADKRLLAVAETDGCFLSGLEVAAGVHVRHRTLRIVDYGRIAVTFADTNSGRAVRLAPRNGCRVQAVERAPAGTSRYVAMLEAYRTMPTDALFSWQHVELVPSVDTLLGRPHVRVDCQNCGEEVVNEREVRVEGRTLCPACAQGAYYRAV